MCIYNMCICNVCGLTCGSMPPFVWFSPGAIHVNTHIIYISPGAVHVNTHIIYNIYIYYIFIYTFIICNGCRV